MILTFISSLTCCNHHQKEADPVPTMHIAGTYLCQTFGIVILSMVHDSAQILFKQEKQRADSHTCSCRMQNE